MVDRSIILTLVEDRRPVCVSLSGRKSTGVPIPLTLTQSDSGRKLEKLSTHDPKVEARHLEGREREREGGREGVGHFVINYGSNPYFCVTQLQFWY